MRAYFRLTAPNRCAGAAKRNARLHRRPKLWAEPLRKSCSRLAPIVFFVWQEGPLDNRNKSGTTGPLAGKRVVVTRAPEQASELIRALEALGAEVLLLPTVGFAPAEDPAELDAAFARLAEFDWILFTSQNAVRFFCSGGVNPDGNGRHWALFAAASRRSALPPRAL